VVAEGYLPEPVTPKLVVNPARIHDLVVRMKRGGTLKGVVLDHTGKPVSGAELFLQGVEFGERAGEKLRPKSNFVTDANGRYAITGIGTGERRLVVSSPSLLAWIVTANDANQELTVRLPQPAALSIRYEIEDAPQVGEFRLELMTWGEMPHWNGSASVQLEPKAQNGKTITVSGLPPGVYDLTRTKTWFIGARGISFPCDRKTITLQAGKTAEAAFVRKGGASLTGQVEGLKEANLPGAFN
jgi:hypothetical protein